MKVRNGLELRSALWVIAHVAASDTGFSVLEANSECTDVLHLIVRLASHADDLSLRGTLFCILALIGHSEKGRAALQALGWIAHKNDGYSSTDGDWVGVCVSFPSAYREWAAIAQSDPCPTPSTSVFPAEPNLSSHKKAAEELFSSHGITTRNAPDFYNRIDSISTEVAHTRGREKAAVKREFCILLALSHRESCIHRAQGNAFEVAMWHVRTMANPMMLDGARKSLAKVRQDATIFHDPHLALELHDLLNTYRFRTATRKYLYDTYVEQAIHTHSAFAYLDARYSPLKVDCADDVDTTPAPLHLDTASSVGDAASSGRSSPALKPASPSLSRGLPLPSDTVVGLSDTSNTSTSGERR